MLDRQVTNSTAIWPLSCWHGASSAISSNPCFVLFVTSRERTIQTPCSHEPATPGRSTGTEAAAGCAGWPVAAARHRVRMLGKRQQKAAVLMPATAAPSNTPRMPHTQLSCCQSAARVPMPPTPQAQPEIRARSCRQSPHRSSHHSGATVPRTIFCAFDLGHE